MILDSIIEFTAAKELYQDCWLTSIPKKYNAPTDAEKKWLWKFLSAQNYYKNLNDVERQNLHKVIEIIENSVPMITSDGTVLSVYHRLYLASLLGRFFIHKEIVSLDVISSIVIYPTYKIRKIYNESGLVVCKGSNMLLQQVALSYRVIDLLTEKYIATRGILFMILPHFKGEFIKKEYQNWIEDLKYIESIISKQQIHFKDKIEQKIKDLEQKITTFTTELSTILLQEDVQLKPFTDGVLLGAQKLINHITTLKDFLPMLNEANQVSIHLSWLSIIENMQNDNDLVAHEMAHVIDFINGGLDGVPNTSRKFKEVWETAFTQEKEEESFLDPYAFTNEMEFFAVCSEAFFKTPELLKHKIPTIYDSLIRVYGYHPQNNKKVKSLDYFKLIYFSKISAFKSLSA
ncbi:zinc-dependent peptidase [Aquimarina sp. 2201CG5-10]|uniref:zinc-dependent peptidase n=1 Tax=Aquimarina callyspongiae TaxID=3098150 RepID=UPI002AB51501|nr:zinc-dependent peptidase [Aquimarina sp. 2201CG5-10]MDY8136054.1 zinc-dependent peptidase [Aquimarina sp. 2201CG5-10]